MGLNSFRLTKTDICKVFFFCFLFCEYVFSYSAISRIAMILFVVAVAFTCKIHWSKYLTAYCFFIVWSIINIVAGYAISSSVALEYTQTCILNLIVLIALVMFFWRIGDVEEVLNIYIKSSVLISIIAIATGIGAVVAGGRLDSIMNSNTVAMFSAYAIIMLIHKLKTKSISGKTAICIIVLCFLTILLSGSRKGLIITLIGLYVLFCFSNPRKIFKVTVICIALVAVVYVLLMKVDVFYSTVGYRVEAVLQFAQGVDVEEGSIVSRNSFINLAWDESQDSLILGHGLANFSLLPGAFGTYSHCNYLEILYSLGWVGVVIYYSPFLWLLGYLMKRIIRRDYNLSLIIALVIPYLVCDYFTVTYFTRKSLIVPAFCIVFSEIYKRRKLSE